MARIASNQEKEEKQVWRQAIASDRMSTHTIDSLASHANVPISTIS